MNIYVSTLALRNHSPERMIALAEQHGWALEFSSGMAYQAFMEDLYLEAAVKLCSRCPGRRNSGKTFYFR